MRGREQYTGVGSIEGGQARNHHAILFPQGTDNKRRVSELFSHGIGGFNRATEALKHAPAGAAVIFLKHGDEYVGPSDKNLLHGMARFVQAAESDGGFHTWGDYDTERSDSLRSKSQELGQVHRTIDVGLLELRGKIGEKQAQALPQGREVVELSREDFQSRTYRNRGYNEHSGPVADGHLYTITFADKSQAFVLYAKDSSNPFAASMGLWGGVGIDMRPWHTFIYEYDGRETITATEPNGRVSTHTGEEGIPSAMLPTVRDSLGHSIGIEHFQARR